MAKGATKVLSEAEKMQEIRVNLAEIQSRLQAIEDGLNDVLDRLNGKVEDDQYPWNQ